MSSSTNLASSRFNSPSNIQTSQQKQNIGTNHLGSNLKSLKQKVEKSEDNPVPMTSLPASNGVTKNHKIEGKNKKSLHHKQQQQVTLSQQRANQQNQQQSSQMQQQSTSATLSNRRVHQKNPNGSFNNNNASESNNVCSTLDDFSKCAQVLKADINKALEKQATHQIIDQPVEVVKLKNDILKLSGLEASNDIIDESQVVSNSESTSNVSHHQDAESLENSKKTQATYNSITPCHLKYDQSNSIDNIDSEIQINNCKTDQQPDNNTSEGLQKLDNIKSSHEENHDNNNSSLSQKESSDVSSEGENKINANIGAYKPESLFTETLDKSNSDEHKSLKDSSPKTIKSGHKKRTHTDDGLDTSSKSQENKTKDHIKSDEFEPLNAKLDLDSKFVALVSSLQMHFTDAPHLLEPVCRKLVNMSKQNGQLMLNCEKYQSENQKLLIVKQKLENLCRELQKSNNAIRIESLDLIKVEQGKAKEQTTKIQSTLSGVIKLFDENQQRNMCLRQENQELQTKLKSLLDHCDNWEKSVEAALRQRDIENRLLKTELAKANLLKNEEKEKFLGEKQELLQILSMMQEQQHRIEGQEAKLRSDLSSYASKYDECQAVISKGMNRFQTESKRMLKQIEKSKHDYKILLSKYESSNKRMAQLLEEKQYWDKAMNLSNKKIETLEKLCRALRERKPSSKTDAQIIQKSNKNKSNKILKESVDQKGQSKNLIEMKEAENLTIANSQPVIGTDPNIYQNIEASTITDYKASTENGNEHLVKLTHDKNITEGKAIDKSSNNENILVNTVVEQPE